MSAAFLALTTISVVAAPASAADAPAEIISDTPGWVDENGDGWFEPTGSSRFDSPVPCWESHLELDGSPSTPDDDATMVYFKNCFPVDICIEKTKDSGAYPNFLPTTERFGMAAGTYTYLGADYDFAAIADSYKMGSVLVTPKQAGVDCAAHAAPWYPTNG